MAICALCQVRSCVRREAKELPKNCPGLQMDRDVLLSNYVEPENYRLAHEAALVEAAGHNVKTRLEEIMDFASRCGFQRLGLAFCAGLWNEARLFHQILSANGFAVESIVCKTCRLPKELINIEDHQKVNPGYFEPMCNPIYQAEYLNKQKTDLNIMLGLCVGHDTLFIKHCQAPVTVFATKDRVLGHNPLAAVYLSDGYYRKKLYPAGKKPARLLKTEE